MCLFMCVGTLFSWLIANLFIGLNMAISKSVRLYSFGILAKEKNYVYKKL